MDFGFTNDISKLNAVNAFREAAMADGWSAVPTFSGEALESYATLNKAGFTMHANARMNPGPKWKYSAQISIWGPDGMAIEHAGAYDWDAIQRGLRHCQLCGADDIEPQRFSFAGRCCEACLPDARAKYEKPGWCD